MHTALKLSLKLNVFNDKRPNAELSVSTHIKMATSPQVGCTVQFSSVWSILGHLSSSCPPVPATAVGRQPVCLSLLAPVGTCALPSCQWVLIIEYWQSYVAAGSGITHGASGTSNQLLSGRGDGDLIKSMVHWCCLAQTPHSQAERLSCTWRTSLTAMMEKKNNPFRKNKTHLILLFTLNAWFSQVYMYHVHDFRVLSLWVNDNADYIWHRSVCSDRAVLWLWLHSDYEPSSHPVNGFIKGLSFQKSRIL